MKRKYLILLISIGLIFGCKKVETSPIPPTPPPPPPPPPPTVAKPIISSISPNSGGYNGLVMLTGKNFGMVAGDGTITLNSINCAVQKWSDTSISILIPEKAGSGIFTLTTSSGQASSDSFTYIPKVFISGSERKGTFYQAKYWINGVSTTLEDSAVANCMFVKGNDIYIAGTKTTNNGNGSAVYWKNGALNYLNAGSLMYGSVLSMFLSGTDIYFAGTAIDISIGSNAAVYWKNGVHSTLTYPNSNVAYSIAVLNNDIYLATNTWGGTSTIPNRGLFWKNNNLSTLFNANVASISSSIYISGNDLYVVGSELDGSKYVAKYWKNGTPVSLTDGTKDAFAISMIVYKNDIYVAGYESNGKDYVAKYWKNGVSFSLSDGTNDTRVTSIQVIDSDVYTVGYEYIGNIKTALYWKNTTKYSLTDGKNDAEATSIFVQ